jgi:outer membrane protein assembly factor BamE (lipoprotein component of BamABCDE complex)
MKVTKIVAYTILLATCFSFLGCRKHESGSKLTQQQVESLKVGMSRNQVEALLGPPQKSSRDDRTGSLTYTYSYASARMNPATYVPIVGLFAGKMDTESSSLSVFFNSRGVVADFVVNASQKN